MSKFLVIRTVVYSAIVEADDAADAHVIRKEDMRIEDEVVEVERCD